VKYTPFDQEAHLGAPPWRIADPAVRAWETAHGHDVRGRCYPEYGCLVIEPALEERLRAVIKRIGNMPNGNSEWSEEYRQGYDKAMARVRAEVACYALDRTETP
jgi:hypothetical protein